MTSGAGTIYYTWECVECQYEKKRPRQKGQQAPSRTGFYLRFRQLAKKDTKKGGRPLEISVHVQDLPPLLQKVWSHAHSRASGFRQHFGPQFRASYLSPYAFRTSRPALDRATRVWPLFIVSKWKPLLALWAEEALYHEELPEGSLLQRSGATKAGKSARSNHTTSPNHDEPAALLGKNKVLELQAAVSYFQKIKLADFSSWSSFCLYVNKTPGAQRPSCDETAWELTLGFVNEHCPLFFLWAVFSQKGMEEFMYLHTSVSAQRVWRWVRQELLSEFSRVHEGSPLGFFTNPLDEKGGGRGLAPLPPSEDRSWRVGLHAEEGGWLEAGDGRHDELFPGFLTPHTFAQLAEGWKRTLLRSMDEDSRNLVFVYWWLQAWCLCTQATGLPECFPNFDAGKAEGRFCFLPFLQLASKLSVPASAGRGPPVLFCALYQRRSANVYVPLQTPAARQTIAKCFETLVGLGLVVKSEGEDGTGQSAFLYKPQHFARVETELAALAQELEEDLRPCRHWTRFVRTHSRLVAGLPNAPPFSEEQLEAQAFLARHPLAVLDGCAGSGKSTVAASLVAGLLPAGVVSITKTAARALTDKVSASASLLSAAPPEDVRRLLEQREAAGSACPDASCPCAGLRRAASAHLRRNLSAARQHTTKQKKGSLRGRDGNNKVLAAPFTHTVEWLVVKARFAAPPPAPAVASPAPPPAQERSKKRQKTGAKEEQLGGDQPAGMNAGAYCLLVDEAETISLFKGLRLLRATLKLAQKPACLFFLGDPQQTAAIGVGNLQAFLKRELPTASLSQSFRFKTNFVMKTLCAWFSSPGATPGTPSGVLPSLSRGALARVFLDRPDPSFFEQRFFHFLRTARPSRFLSPSAGPGTFQVITFRNEERRRANEWGYRFELARRVSEKWSSYLRLPAKKRPLFLGLSVVVRCSPWLPPPDSLCVLEEGAAQQRREGHQAKLEKWVLRPEEAEAIPGTQGVVVGLFLVRVLAAQRKVLAPSDERDSAASSSTPRANASLQDPETAPEKQRRLLLIKTCAQVGASCVLPTSVYSQKPRPRGRHAKGTYDCLLDAADAYKGFWLKVLLDTGKRDEAGSPVCEEVLVDPNDPFQGGDCLQLAYALSVPAVTGLQYQKAVTWVSPKPFSPMNLHSRKLVYTGLSRNVAGTPEVWRCGERNTSSGAVLPRATTRGASEATDERRVRSDEEWVRAFRDVLGIRTRREREARFKGRASLVPLVEKAQHLAWDMHRNP